MVRSIWRRRTRSDRDRLGTFFFRIVGPATVEGALQGCSAEARDQWKRYRENARRADRERDTPADRFAA